jgi:hypothetical protein
LEISDQGATVTSFGKVAEPSRAEELRLKPSLQFFILYLSSCPTIKENERRYIK